MYDLNNVQWNSAYVFEDLNDIFDHWLKLYTDIIDEHMPFKRRYVRGDQLPWITPEIIKAITCLNKLLKKFRKSRSDDD